MPNGARLLPRSSLERLARAAVTGGSGRVTALALLLAFAVGGLVIAFSDHAVLASWGSFPHAPGAALSATWHAVANAYGALLRGAILDPHAVSLARRGGSLSAVFSPLSETVVAATPLVLAGLSVALAFRAGLFNIGGQGQAALGATAAAFVGFHFHLPVVVHVVCALSAGIVVGAAWGAIPGLLKARTGAHEVITTIMLNYVASIVVVYLLSKSVFLRPGRTDAISPIVDRHARLPLLAGSGLRLHAGVFVALAAALLVGWLISRTTIGFEFRCTSLNERAARTAGIRIPRIWTLALLLAGAAGGLAGAVQLLGTDYTLVPGTASGLGFVGISVALLGRATVKGTVAASLLYGALEAGGLQMQAATAVPLDIVTVIQALIVLFIATPRLIRGAFGLRGATTDAEPAVTARGW